MENHTYDPAHGKNHRPDVPIPEGYEKVDAGYLIEGDLAWNPTRTVWQEVTASAVQVGHPVKDYYAICRKKGVT